jgi:hypothetical protein
VTKPSKKPALKPVSPKSKDPTVVLGILANIAGR